MKNAPHTHSIMRNLKLTVSALAYALAHIETIIKF